MREVPGRVVPVNGRYVYVEESGQGQDRVVFEAGGGCGRTCWDPVLPPLADKARLVTYDRAGRALSDGGTQLRGVDDMAADLVAMTEAVVPGEFVLVAHSMGGLVARRAAERLGSRLRGLLLVDPLPETSPVYDTWDQTTKKIDHMLAMTQTLSRIPPLSRLFSGNVRRLFSAGTYRTMLAEDFTPPGSPRPARRCRRWPPPFRSSVPGRPGSRTARRSCCPRPTPPKAESASTPRSASTSAATPRPCPTGATRTSPRGTSSRPSNHTSSPPGYTTSSAPIPDHRAAFPLTPSATQDHACMGRLPDS
ncbi:alpha/beta fold hydrolase [Nonomuraea wenchangensis]|uniref:alpha/beta fold hydrolase n=1 Tax=Nonomuraea wenchangensis TaxID=568860 RepID=UPI003431A22D